jgi:hypothetical protein
MAGSVSNSEIEDFVSSVRRLVSADPRNRPVSRDLRPERLVLTPAQRVVPEPAVAVEPLILTTRALDEEPTGPSPLEEVGLTFAEAPMVVEAEWEEEIWTEPEAPLAELALGAEEAEVVAEVAAGTADADADAGTAEGSSPWAEVGDDWLDEDLELLAPGQAPPKASPPVEEPATDRQAKRPDVLRLSAEDMLTDGEGNPLTVLDEAALQQIIRQLIREELKGVLGERITQSVRKLVRAEINRALAAHALD